MLRECPKARRPGSDPARWITSLIFAAFIGWTPLCLHVFFTVRNDRTYGQSRGLTSNEDETSNDAEPFKLYQGKKDASLAIRRVCSREAYQSFAFRPLHRSDPWLGHQITPQKHAGFGCTYLLLQVVKDAHHCANAKMYDRVHEPVLGCRCIRFRSPVFAWV